MLVRFANDACSAQLLLLYSAIYLLYQIKQITACDLCTLTRDKKLNRDYLLYFISHLTIAPSLSSSPQRECHAWLTTVKGFRFAPMNDPHHPPPHQSPLTVVPHAQRHLCGELLKKKWQGMPFFSEIVPVKHHRCTNFL